MAIEKKRPGRKKKEEILKEDINENKEKISMKKNTESSVDIENKNLLNNTVNTINNTNIANDSKTLNQVTINQVQHKLADMFSNFTQKGVSAMNFQNTLSDTFKDNPFIQNQRIKQVSSNISSKSKQDVIAALVNPQNNEQLFREQSMALFFQNYVYGNLLRLNRDIPKFFNYILPQGVDKKKLQSDNFKKEKVFLNKFIDKLNPPLILKKISLQVAQEGKCTYVPRISYNKQKQVVNFVELQKLPSDYIKYIGMGSENPFICSFNFLMFLNPIHSITDYPDWFGKIWEELQTNGIIIKEKENKLKFKPKSPLNSDHIIEYNSSGYAYWVTLPQNLTITFGADLSTPLQLPEYIGLFSDLKELESYKWLQAQTMLTNITNILTAEVELAKEASANSDASILSVDTILGLQDSCTTSLNSNVLSFFAPLKEFKLHSIEHIPNAMDISLKELRNVISTSGNSALLNTSDKPSIAMIKGSQSLQEEKMQFLTLQFERYINNLIKKELGLVFEYKFYLWGGIFSWKDDFKIVKELLISGLQGMLPRILSVYNTTLEDYQTCCDYMDVLGIVVNNNDKLEKGNSKVVGRPETDENDIENDNTAISKETGSNVSDNKEFSSDTCIKCGEELEDDEELICDDCLEEYYSQRIEDLQEEKGDLNE